MKAHRTYPTYRNGQKVEEVRGIVLNVLQTVVELKADVEAGRQLSEKEYRLTRELLDAHEQHLRALGLRVESVELVTSKTAAEVAYWRKRAQDVERRIYRPGCGYHRYWNGSKCVEK